MVATYPFIIRLANRKDKIVYNLIELLDELSRPELVYLISMAKAKLLACRKMTIHQNYKKCGKENCTCQGGAARHYGHGPYLVASYTQGGKRRQKSLGLWQDEDYFIGLEKDPLPEWFQFAVGEAEYGKMAEARQWETHERTLVDYEFKKYYDVAPEEDKMHRPWRLRFDARPYRDALKEWDENRKVIDSPFRRFGVAKPSSISWLARMIGEEQYYLPE